MQPRLLIHILFPRRRRHTRFDWDWSSDVCSSDLGRIGETPRGGLTRLALSDEDKRGRDWMVSRMREAGLSVSVDQMGNIFGERAGAEPLPPVLLGSHVDSVPTGGKYDGQLGVLCALETLRSLDDHAIRTRHPVTLVIFTNEDRKSTRLNSSHSQ